MTQRTDGGPAFPTPRYERGDMYSLGMTLRDYFAAKAMQAAYAHFSGETDHTKHWTTEGVAESAYAMADAMLKAMES